MTKRILIITDSLSLPRDHPEIVSYEETYTYLLKKKYSDFEIIQFGHGGATIKTLFEQASYLKMMAADIIILQAGIVDCAPRSLTKFEIDLINRIPFISKLIYQVVNKYSTKLRKSRNITYSTETNFKLNLIKLKNTFPNSNFYCLGILLANANYEVKVPNISNNIKIYNQILKTVFNKNFIDTSSIDNKGIMSDNIHLNQMGHKRIFDLVVKNILKPS